MYCLGVIRNLGIYMLLPSIRNMTGTARGTLKDRAITVARERGIARARDFDAACIPRAYLRRLQDEGFLVRIGRGLYQLADAQWSESHSLAEAARAVPHGVICLLAALRFHELTTQLPHQVWMLIGHGQAVKEKCSPVAGHTCARRLKQALCASARSKRKVVATAASTSTWTTDARCGGPDRQLSRSINSVLMTAERTASPSMMRISFAASIRPAWCVSWRIVVIVG